MHYRELQKGSFVKWTANRMFKEWNTYGIVTQLTKENVTIKTFDDMKETKLGLRGEAIEEEISPATLDEVTQYLHLRELDLQKKIIETEMTFKKDMTHLQKHIDVLHDLLKGFPI